MPSRNSASSPAPGPPAPHAPGLSRGSLACWAATGLRQRRPSGQPWRLTRDETGSRERFQKHGRHCQTHIVNFLQLSHVSISLIIPFLHLASTNTTPHPLGEPVCRRVVCSGTINSGLEQTFQKRRALPYASQIRPLAHS
ncbi:uncharacterized protein LOC144315690 [Canis aureus]